jgi:multicomponent Na+:H+ antiporter subunit D
MNALIVAPILIPLISAIACMFAWTNLAWQRVVSVVGAIALLASAIGLLVVVRSEGIQAAQMGNWPAPFGITMVADLFSAIMVVLAGIVAVAVALYGYCSIDEPREQHGYHPLYQVLLMGVCGAFLTGDIFNLYVWFEVMLMASFVLLALGGERAQVEGAIKYVTLNLISSALFLAAIGLLYGLAGTLNMADLGRKLAEVEDPRQETIIALLFMISFGIKSAAFPLFFWLPASYHSPPAAVSAVFAGLLTKVGVYALIRVFSLIFVHEMEFTHTLILIVAGLTMVTGVLGAAAQYEFRRILSFHIVSQIGYMLMGLGLFTELALTGSVFYIMHHIIVKANLFLVSGVVRRIRGTYDLKLLGGLFRDSPMISILFLIPAMSLAGVPPLSGFFSKLILIRAGLEEKSYVIVVTALAVSLLTVFSMMKIWNEAFWKKPPEEEMAGQKNCHRLEDMSPDGRRGVLGMLVPIVLLGGLTIMIGVLAEPMFHLAQETVRQLLDPHGPGNYVETVLGPRS